MIDIAPQAGVTRQTFDNDPPGHCVILHMEAGEDNERIDRLEVMP